MRLVRATAAAVLAVGIVAAGSPPGHTTARGHDIVYLATPKATFPFYQAATSGYLVNENAGSVNPMISREQHGRQSGQVDYETVVGSATPDADYEPADGTVTLLPTDLSEFQVDITDDADAEGTPETFDVRLTNPQPPNIGMILGFPNRATVTIVDNDGAARVSFAAANYEQFENRLRIEPLVVRQGDASGALTVQLQTTDGTATSPEDYTTVNKSLTFAAGERSKSGADTRITLNNDSLDEGDHQLTVTLTGASVVEPSTATVTIRDDDSSQSDSTPPVSAFHLPLNNRTYGPRHVATKQLHVSPSDEGSGIAEVGISLRKKLRDGSCRWWGGAGWRNRPCSSKLWRTIDCPEPDSCLLAIYPLEKRLRPTTRKTGIRYYTAWARSKDFADNQERDLDPGRNQSKFWVNPRR